MSNIQETFDRIQKAKAEQKELKSMYRDALSNSANYQKTLEEYNQLRDEKKKRENSIKEEFRSEFVKLEVIKNELMNDSQVLSDMIMAKVAKGEKIEIKDAYETQYEPIFKVVLKKIS
jgi:hypothetical protein